jgi:DNA mismatch repair protein MutL
MSIIILDESVANKIAAGEVIERPASVVKELMENSIDAGASSITVEVADGGRRLIRVTDDGCGMSKQDAVLSLQRHATSKIHTAEDLAAISTLGFRGEALPSIATVSVFEMITAHTGAAAGVRLSAQGGTITELAEAGAPAGTQVAVANLFFNVPARLKFLRSDATEYARIADAVTRYALAFPHLGLRLLHNGRETFDRPAGQDLSAAVLAIYGRQVLEALVPVEFSQPDFAVTGLISSPELTRSTRQAEHFFVNRRPIQSRILLRALEQVYRGALPSGRFPIAVLLLDMDPQAVDVNVHPAKAEVRFARESEVYRSVLQAAREALERKMAGASVAPASTPAAAPGATTLRQPLRTHAQGRPSAQVRHSISASVPMAQAPLPVQPKAAEVGPAGLTALGQWRNTYIVADSPEGLVLVNQHRAHERVLYEQFERAAASGQPQRQHLVAPLTLHFSPAEAAVLEKNLDQFSKLGFELEPFGSGTLLLRAVPAPLAKLDPESLVHDLAEDLLATPAAARTDPMSALLAGLACHSAVRAGDPLSREEMDRLLSELAQTSQPFACPHGAPLLITFPQGELDRKFLR